MLKDILKEIYKANVFSKVNISNNLNITEELLDDGIGQLVRMGYLLEDLGSPSCETKCSTCAFTKCNIVPIKMFTITDKGKKLIDIE